MFASGFIAIAVLISLSVAEVSFGQSRSSFGGRLLRSVSDASPDDPLTSKDRGNVPELVRTRFDNFVRCRATFRSRLPLPKTFFEKAASTHQRTLERALTCLFTGPAIAALATEYAGNARILYEWEGLPSSPIEEASYAEEYIARIRTRRLRPTCICSRRSDGDTHSNSSRATATRKALSAARPSIVT